MSIREINLKEFNRGYGLTEENKLAYGFHLPVRNKVYLINDGMVNEIIPKSFRSVSYNYLDNDLLYVGDIIGNDEITGEISIAFGKTLVIINDWESIELEEFCNQYENVKRLKRVYDDFELLVNE